MASYPEAPLVIIKLIINLAFVICNSVQETSHVVVFDTWNHFFRLRRLKALFNVKAPDEEERTRNVHFHYPRFELITIFIFSALIGKFTMF